MRRRLIALLVVTVLVAGCAAGRAFRKGRDAARAGDWDTAVQHFTEALQANPDSAEYKIELERAMQNASRDHISKARDLEAKDQLDAALLEYKKAVEMDASNRLAATRAAELERIIRDRIEKSRPRPAIEKLRQQARAQGVPVLNPADRTPLKLSFNNSSVRDILNFIGTTTGINIQFDAHYQDRAYTVNLDDVTLEEALQQIMSVNGLFYKVLNPTTIVVAMDNQAGHLKYDELVMQVFYLSHADTQEVSQALNQMMRIQAQVAPAIYPNKTSNTIAVRATAPIVAVAERLIRSLDKPRAEVIIEVQILEVNRNRAKSYGINLSEYALGLTFSPEVAPPNTPGSNPPTPPPPFNLNTISQGISTSDFYLTVPDGRTQVPRDGLPDQAARQAAAAWRRGPGTDPQPRRPDSRGLDRVRRGSGRWLCQHPAVVVHVSGRRRQHHDDPARHLRRGDHSRPHGREQQPRPQHQRCGTGCAVIRIAPREDAAAAARRRVESARRPLEGRPAEDSDGLYGADPRARSAVALWFDERRHRADRHRHVADAAYRPDARVDGRRPGADLHRHAAECRAERSAAADSAAGRRRCRQPRRCLRNRRRSRHRCHSSCRRHRAHRCQPRACHRQQRPRHRRRPSRPQQAWRRRRLVCRR